MSEPLASVYVELRADGSQLEGDVKKSVAEVQKSVDVKLALRASKESIKSLESVYAQLSAAAKLPSVAGNPMQSASVQKDIAGVLTDLTKEQNEYDRLTAAIKQNTVATDTNVKAQGRQRTQFATGFRSNLLNIARDAGKGAGIGELAAFAGKAGAVGLGITATYQAVNQLQGALRVTGEEAETTGGRMRNFGASLLSGDVIGAIKAAGNASDTLNASEAALLETNPQLQESFKKVFGEAKIGSQILADLAAQAELLGKQQGVLSKALEGVNPENLTAIQSRISALVPGQDSKAIADAIQAQLRAQVRARDNAQNTQFDLLKARAEQKGDSAVIGVLNARKTALGRQISNLEEAGSTTVASKERLVSLYGQLESVDGEITSLRKKALDEQKKQLEEQHRVAQAQAQLAFTTISIQAANATNRGQEITALQADAAAAREFGKKKVFTEQERLGFELQAANDDRQVRSIRAQIASEEASAAKEAARLAEEEKKRQDEKLKRQQEAAKQLRELRLSNAEAKAGLTKSTADDKKAIQNTIAYWKEKVANLTGLDREQARSELIGARGRLKGLKGSGATASVGDFFKEVLSDFRSFGSNFSSGGSPLSPQGARGAFSAAALGKASGKTVEHALAEESSRTSKAQLAEQRRQTALLSSIATAVTKSGTLGGVKKAKVPHGSMDSAILGAGLLHGA